MKDWIIPTVNITYTRLQNYTNVVGDEHGIQTFGVVVVVLLLLTPHLSPQVHIPYYFQASG